MMQAVHKAALSSHGWRKEKKGDIPFILWLSLWSQLMNKSVFKLT